jgi:sterol 24-C-methyltransferase
LQCSSGLTLCYSPVTYRLVPQGTYKVQAMLQQGGWGCAQGGYTGTFTPMWLMVARKPLR